MNNKLNLKTGDRVVVRDYREIVQTLDENGALDGMPFMPEMIQYCNQEFTVSKRVERTCVEPFRIKGMDDTVLLGSLRCGGQSHDGCQRNCTILWKESWLKKVNNNSPISQVSAAAQKFRVNYKTKESEKYYCQLTEINKFSLNLGRIQKIKRVINEIRYGNHSIYSISKMFVLSFLRAKSEFAITNNCRNLRSGTTKTPNESLKLKKGDLIEVKDKNEIIETINKYGKNKGLGFAPEMFKYCGKTMKVLYPINKMIDEVSGKMVELSDAVLLTDSTCSGVCTFGCPRNEYYIWKEIWLKKLE